MNTSQLVTNISKTCLNYKTRSEILDLINIAQNELLAVDCDLMRVKPDPFLATTDGVYEYDTDLGIRAVRHLMTRDPRNLEYNQTNPQFYPFKLLETDKDGNQIYEVPIYTEDSADPDSQGKIIFDSDRNPSTTTDLYRMRAYKWPEQLTSTSIPLTCPVQHRVKALKSRVMMMIEEEKFGRADRWEKKFEKQEGALEKELMRSLNTASTSITPIFA